MSKYVPNDNLYNDNAQSLKIDAERAASSKFDLVGQTWLDRDSWAVAAKANQALSLALPYLEILNRDKAAPVQTVKDDDTPEKVKAQATLNKLIEIDPDKLSKLIKQLGDGEFEVREAAHKAILELGPGACPKIQEQELDNPDAEIRRHCTELLHQNLYDGALIPIKNKGIPEDQNNPAIIGALLAVGAVDPLLGNGARDTKEVLQLKVKSAAAFADDPKLTAERVGRIEQLLAQHTLGKLSLNKEQQEDLQTELKDLKQIGPLSGALEIALARRLAFAADAGDYSGTKSALKNAFKHDKNLINDEQVIRLILHCGIDKSDKEFMESYKKSGGNFDEVERVRAEVEAERKRAAEMRKLWQDQVLPAQGMPAMQKPPA